MPHPSSPTGRQLAVAFARKFPGEDWIARLSERSGMDRDTVEWHLQEDMVPPVAIMKAASEMEGEPEQRGDATARDDLPLAGLPGNLGKLYKD
ncbi:hypothetical protein [Bosea sp. Root381]|uniref:hypothetical protein n=1 Tax=Bosea sp. Root381 TaxID=1736524 RepID=UPI0012E3F450|nr:hypothetical protein [Bosea sp. Root381]